MKFEFTIEQLKVIDMALQELPFRIASPLIIEINNQINSQRDSESSSE